MAAREPGATISRLFGDLPRDHRDALERTPGTPHATSDVAACLLGLDLWRDWLASFRDHLLASEDRPHLWTFEFGTSGTWNASWWRSLPLPARLVRARAGAVDRTIRTRVSAWSLSLQAATFRDGITRWQASQRDDNVYEFPPLAPSEVLITDLALVEIIAHWLWRLSDRERALADWHATGFEVHGYDQCCGFCRARWGLRPRNGCWVPPFHPGCRCYAQPRFARTS